VVPDRDDGTRLVLKNAAYIAVEERAIRAHVDDTNVI
jgi:hypothetical protein